MIQMDLLTLFFHMLAGPCSCAVDSVHKYTGYWLNTNNPTIPSDECQTYVLEGHSGSVFQIKTFLSRLSSGTRFSSKLFLVCTFVHVCLISCLFCPVCSYTFCCCKFVLTINKLAPVQFSTELSGPIDPLFCCAFINLKLFAEASCAHSDLHCCNLDAFTACLHTVGVYKKLKNRHLCSACHWNILCDLS